MRMSIPGGAAAWCRQRLKTPRQGRRLPFRRGALAVIAALAGLPAVHAEPLTLTDAWQAARDHDPDFQAARHELDAGLQSMPIGRAGLLPKVSAIVSAAKVDGDRTAPNSTGASVKTPLDYVSRQNALQLRQPIYNREAIARFQLGRVQADYARAVFAGAELDLVTRVASAYLDLMLAQDLIELGKAQQTAYEEQAKRANANFARGEGTRTDISDAEARAALARADFMDANDHFAVAQQALAAIVGQEPVSLPALITDWTPPLLDPPTLDIWLETAREKSPQIDAERFAFEAAKRNVSIARAGYQPTVDLVASVGESKSDSVSTLNQRYQQNTVGVQLNVPLYAGGGVKARATQAAANQAREGARLDATVNKVLLEIRRNWLATTNAWAKIGAYQSAVDSALTLQRGVEVGIRAGMNVPSDALNATRLLYVSRRDLAKARYDYLMSRLKLQATAGVLAEEDIRTAASMFR